MATIPKESRRYFKQEAEASIGAANTFTTPIYLLGPFNLSVSGTFDATVTLQRSFDGGNTWVDVKTYTAPAEDVGDEPESEVLYRVGVKTGEYTSGTAEVRVSQ